jgi:hypothetical protein
MRRRAKDLVGFRIHATDGDIGHVRDLYFDEQQWLVRHVVVADAVRNSSLDDPERRVPKGAE